jgi:hypothetical protein
MRTATIKRRRMPDGMILVQPEVNETKPLSSITGNQ